ncbi:MAG: PilN domain-containing protein [Anaerocolumna sp.]
MMNDINLIPKSGKNASKETIIISTVAYVCLFIVIVFLGYFIPLHQKNQIKREIVQKEAELLKYADTEETYQNLTNTISEMQNKITYFDTLKSSLKMSKILGDLEGNIPSSINIVNMSLAEGILTINGVSPSYKEVARYMVKLRALDYVKAVSFSSAVLEDDEESKELYDFNINIILNMPEIVLKPLDETAAGTKNETDKDVSTGEEASENEAN